MVRSPSGISCWILSVVIRLYVVYVLVMLAGGDSRRAPPLVEGEYTKPRPRAGGFVVDVGTRCCTGSRELVTTYGGSSQVTALQNARVIQITNRQLGFRFSRRFHATLIPLTCPPPCQSAKKRAPLQPGRCSRRALDLEKVANDDALNGIAMFSEAYGMDMLHGFSSHAAELQDIYALFSRAP